MAIMWGEFFKRFAFLMDGSLPVASARDVERAYEFWRLIPDMERRRCWPFNGPAADRLGRGFGFHRTAEQILMAAAERLGMDPSPIRESGDICYNLLRRQPRMAYKTTSTLIAYWPHCLGPRLTGLSAQEKEAVRKAEGVLARLLVKIRLKPDSGTALTLTPDAAIAKARSKTPGAIKEGGLVFICYCRKDEKWLDEMRKMLVPVIKGNVLPVWHDQKIRPGKEWRREIAKALRKTKVGVLLVTKNFLASEFINKVELKYLRENAKTNRVRLLPVSVGHCMWENSPLARLQFVNDPEKPLEQCRGANLNKHLKKVCEKIAEAYNENPPPNG
jgi:hypothetical protein